MATVKKTLRDGRVAFFKDDGTVIAFDKSGAATDLQGNKIDMPGAAVPPERREYVPPRGEFAAERLITPIAATAGSIALSPLGPQGRIAGGALAAIPAETATQFIEAIRGKPTAKTGGEAVERSLTAGAVAGGFEALGEGAFGLGRLFKTRGAAQKGMGEFAEKIRGKQGVKGVLTDIGQGIKESFKRGALGKKLIDEPDIINKKLLDAIADAEQSNIKATQGFKGMIEQEASKFGTKKGRIGFGEEVKDIFARTVKAKRYIENKLWKKIPENAKVGDVSSTKTIIKDFINKETRGFEGLGKNQVELYAEAGKRAGMKPEEVMRGMNIAQDVGERGIETKLVSAETSDIKFLSEILEDLEKKELSFGDLKKIKNMIYELGDYKSVRAKGMDSFYNKIAHSLSEDMAKTAEIGGFKEAADKARVFSREFFRFSDSKVGRGLKSKEPSELVDFLIGSDNPSRVREAMTNFSEKGRTVLRRGFIDRMVQKTGYNQKSFAKAMSKYGDDTIEEIFGKDADGIFALRDMAEEMNKKIAAKITAMKPMASFSELEKETVRVLNESKSSELIDIIVRDKSPELIESSLAALDEPGQKLLKNGVLTKIILESTDETGKTLNIRLLGNKLSQFKDEAIEALFGKDAQDVMILRDAARYVSPDISRSLGDDLSRVSVTRPLSFIPVLRRVVNKMTLKERLGERIGRTIGEESIQPKTFGVSFGAKQPSEKARTIKEMLFPGSPKKRAATSLGLQSITSLFPRGENE